MTPTGSVPPSHSRSRRPWWALALVPLALGGVGWWCGGGADDGLDAVVANASGDAARGGALGTPPAREAAPGDAARAEAPRGTPAQVPAQSPKAQELQARRELWTKRLERAKHTLDAYLAATRYPPQSRPSSEHPDQMDPAEPERRRPLSRDNKDVQLRLKQDRVFLVGDEVVHFFVSCEDAHQGPRPCEVLSASAHEAEHMTGGAGPDAVPVAFVDSGAAGDVLAGDRTFTGRFQPSKQGFPMYAGTLRVNVRVRSGTQEGTAFFDILYTPSPPAKLTGQVREVLEESSGSLQLYLGMVVRKAGRYVVAGRVDDESGMPFAYVSFNEELKEGAQEVKFTIPGNLVHDHAPTFPLKLRDVEGFLLKEVGDPDRELLATLRGYVHTTREYPSGAFSTAEWQSEEKDRYRNEYTQDVEEAQAQLNAILAEEGAQPPKADRPAP
ncbi:MAG TPA: hypothetical protein VE153_04995 [Myxococcus sp.]|nr:hypothetical protein [Myxococcus sp.]